MFYLYQDKNNYFLSIDEKMNLSRTKKIEKATYFTKEKSAKTWEIYVRNKYPSMEMKSATLKLID